MYLFSKIQKGGEVVTEDNLYTKNISVIIVAGGSGSRMGIATPKQYLHLCGKPIVLYSIEKFQVCNMINEIIVVVSPGMELFFKEKILEGNNFSKISGIVSGGRERQQSVYNGLGFVDKNADIVLIHDAARPLIRMLDVENLIDATIKYDSCVLGVLAKDTIKVTDREQIVLNTPDRQNLYCVQTPQAFKYDIIMEAHEKAVKENFKGTDDAMLVENLGVRTKIVIGSYDNIKVTTTEDLLIAETLLNCFKE